MRAERNFSLSFLISSAREITRQRNIPRGKFRLVENRLNKLKYLCKAALKQFFILCITFTYVKLLSLVGSSECRGVPILTIRYFNSFRGFLGTPCGVVGFNHFMPPV